MTRRVLLGTLWVFGLFAVLCHHVPVLQLQSVEVQGGLGSEREFVAKLLHQETLTQYNRLTMGSQAFMDTCTEAISGWMKAKKAEVDGATAGIPILFPGNEEA